MNKSLFELSSELAPLESEMEKVGGDTENNEALVAKIEELLTKTSNKIDHFGEYANYLQSAVDAMANEEKRLKDRRSVFENRIERLKDLAKASMEKRGITSIEGQLHTISLAKNGGNPPVELLAKEDDIPDIYIRVRRDVDMTALREDLKLGKPEAKAVARLGETGTSIRIK